MSRTAALIASCLGLAVACGGGERHPAVPAPPPSSGIAPPPPDAGADASPSSALDASKPDVVRLEPVAVKPAEPAPHVEILFPFAEQRILVPKAASYLVRLSVSGLSPVDARSKVELSLDGERPRRVRDLNATKLSELVPEGASPKPGMHWLSAAVVDDAGSIVRGNGSSLAPFAQVRFWVGERPTPPPPPEPHVVLWQPQGTFNGDARSDAVRVDFLASPERLGASSGGAVVHVFGGAVDVSRRLSSWEPLRVEGLPSGDYRVSVELVDQQGKALGSAGASTGRLVTVNRDVALGEP